MRKTAVPYLPDDPIPGRDALELMDEWFPPTLEEMEDRETHRAEMDVAALIYDARTAAGLTQKELADRIGTKASAISRLEDADYQGHSMAMLRRVAKALGKRVVVRLEDEPAASPESQEQLECTPAPA